MLLFKFLDLLEKNPHTSDRSANNKVYTKQQQEGSFFLLLTGRLKFQIPG